MIDPVMQVKANARNFQIRSAGESGGNYASFP